MAITFSESVTIEAPRGTVWEYLTDVDNDPAWQKTTVSARFTSEGPTAVGRTGVHNVKVMGMTDEFGWRITEHQEAERLAWTITSGPAEGGAGYTLEGAGESTTLTFAGEMQPKGLRRAFAPMMQSMFAKESRADLERLKGILEAASS